MMHKGSALQTIKAAGKLFESAFRVKNVELVTLFDIFTTENLFMCDWRRLLHTGELYRIDQDHLVVGE